jgi:ribosomal protein S18 acetylase RimI-like enzyme
VIDPAVDGLDAFRAHADTWTVLARALDGRGGAAAELPGVRVGSTGLPHAQWNSGDVHDPDAVDVTAVRAWYADRAVPWGLRLPAGEPWTSGRYVLGRRLMAREGGTAAAPPTATVEGLDVRPAGASDLDVVLAVDSAAFGTDPEQTRPWLATLLSLSAAGVTVAVAELAGEPVATAYSVFADGWAGPSLYLAGVGVVESARRRGIGTAVTSWLLDRGVDAGAQLAHLSPDSDEAARLYARLGFVEVRGFDVYVDV